MRLPSLPVAVVRRGVRIACVTVVLVAAMAPPSTARLGRDVVPTSQTVRLVLDARQPDYTGVTAISLRVSKASPWFEFNARNITLTAVTLQGADGEIPSTVAAVADDRMRVTPAQPIPRGDYTLTLAFASPFNTLAVSLYRLESGGEAYAFTQLEADEAREAFPCWDEPEFKIPWQLTLVVPESHLAISNTPIELETVANGSKTVRFKRTPPMPSYLVALATGPLETVDIPGMSVPGRVVTVKGAAGLTGEAVRMAPPLLAALERYFDVPYPYEKLDILALPEFMYGAMENPGAITFTDESVLLDPRLTSPSQRRRLASTLAHEMAHMWFGDYVTMAWWDDLWLNESFASWLGDQITQQVFPEFDMNVGEVEQAARAFASDARLSTRAIRQPLTGDVNLNLLADELAYDKGQMMLGMFEQWIGPETFRLGVVDYIRVHAWKNATADDLWAALGKASGREIGRAMATFLNQPGLALVSATVSGSRVTLRQRRMLPYGVSAPAAQTWRIPVVLRFSDGTKTYTQSVLLTEAEQTYTLAPKITPVWLHPNAGERGYYRWSLDPKALLQLAAEAPRALDTRERVGFLGNLGALLDAGEIHGDAYLRTLAAFGADPEPEVVGAVIRGLERAQTEFVTPDLVAPFAQYVRATIGPALERAGFAPRPGESPAASATRGQLIEWLGDAGQDPRVRAWAHEQLAVYLKTPTAVDASLSPAIVRTAALEGDAVLYDVYRARFENARLPVERVTFLNGLGAFRDPALFERTLRYAIEGPLRPQDFRGLLRERANDDATRERTFRFLMDHYDAIAGRMPPEARARLPAYADGCRAQQVEAAKGFFSEPAHRIPGTERTLAKTMEKVLDCADLREREGPAVSKFLRSGTTATAN